MKSVTPRNAKCSTLVMAALMVSFLTPLSAVASNGSMSTVAAHATRLRQSDLLVGALPNTRPMHIVIALKLRNRQELDRLVAAHQVLGPARALDRYTPTPSQAQAVARYLSSVGFKNVEIAPNDLLVSADGNAGIAQAAFHTSFARVQTAYGAEVFANINNATVPISMRDSVLSVIGLQNVYKAHTIARRVQRNISGASITGHNPTNFSSIYGGEGLPTAAGVSIGIISEGDLTTTLSDLILFSTHNNLPAVRTQLVYTGAMTSDQSGTGEWDLDSQDIVGIAGGEVGKLVFYVMPDLFNPSLVSAFNTVVAANAVKIINVSLGECELGAQQDGSAAAADQIFELAVAQGQTFSVSSGDSGSNECDNGTDDPSWPTDSPYVVSVGGTTLDASTTTWNNETVWVDAGGGPSSFESKPSWQDDLVPGTKRGVPDVAFDADPISGALIYLYGGIQLYGGTSLASPLFVGEWARLIAIKGTKIGFAAPQLYQLPTSVFHDITRGNNGGEFAKVGYDFASGRGSMILSTLANYLGVANPLVADFRETSHRLIAKFKDESTDSAGPIISHVWNLGDGSTTSAVNPSHLYPRAGNYRVSETVSDNAGFSNTKTLSVKIK